MKTADETKKALEHCSAKKPCTSCPMWEECKEAASLKPLWDNALALIRQLEAANTELLTRVKQLEAKCHQLEQEREAAVAALAAVRDCDTCKHAVLPGSLREYACMADDYDCSTCEATDCPCQMCKDGSAWEFGGVKRDK